uniref:Mediator of RNA polymerase II transcription subunit 10 n=1 Tax=Vitis vinifera TaxID=29760 RepID=A5BR75_VITVI|nr:hypothetical protein VITISV_026967 [Vitis vinifera]
MESSQNAASGTGVSGGNGITIPQINAAAAAAVAATAGAGSEDPKQNLNQVINSIQKTLGLLHQLYLTVSSFNVASQLPLLQRLNALVSELDNMTKLSEKCNIQVPMEVLNWGLRFVRQLHDWELEEVDVFFGRLYDQSIRSGFEDTMGLRRHLLEELEQAFPDEVESYREIRAASAAESKRLAQAQSVLPNGDLKIFQKLPIQNEAWLR